MLRKTLEFLVRFDRYGIAKGLKAAVNLSVHHFRSFHIVSVIKAQLQEFQLCPNRLEVEITEAALLENSDIANEVLTQIKSLGVHISLDDFGTGYSSLSYLRQLPIDTVKIDLSFIRNMLENERNEQIVKGMISLCQDLQLEILAEGVESIEQVKSLIKMGCNQMQGYYISKPLDESNFIKWCKLRQVVAS
jgi:EAL domain-containing protein (putative c-di-GMP-specific phosphodiesterase class I)